MLDAADLVRPGVLTSGGTVAGWRDAIRQVRAHRVLLLILATAALHSSRRHGPSRSPACSDSRSCSSTCVRSDVAPSGRSRPNAMDQEIDLAD